MARLLNRLRRFTGTPGTKPPRPDRGGTIYKPLEPLDKRVAGWRTVIEDPRQLAVYDKVCASVDRSGYRALQEKHRNLVQSSEERAPAKYIDLAPWFMIHSRLAVLLDIDVRPACSILDIGSGGGHFLAIAKAYGHSVRALDQPKPEIYAELVSFFDIDLTPGGVALGEPMPAEIGVFDLICVNGQVFDTHSDSRLRWKLPEWTGFLQYLTKNHLNSPGELFIGLNKSDGPTGTEEFYWPLVDLAESAGASVDRKYATMDFKLDAPLTFPDHQPVQWPRHRSA